jgi:hypothetical protein
LAQIAAANQNKVGLVATNIGRVQSSMPGEGENVERFERRQRKLLNRLFQALQVGSIPILQKDGVRGDLFAIVTRE